MESHDRRRSVGTQHLDEDANLELTLKGNEPQIRSIKLGYRGGYI